MSANKVDVNKTVLSPMIGMFIFIKRCQGNKYEKLLHENLMQTSYILLREFSRVNEESEQQKHQKQPKGKQKKLLKIARGCTSSLTDELV